MWSQLVSRASMAYCLFFGMVIVVVIHLFINAISGVKHSLQSRFLLVRLHNTHGCNPIHRLLKVR